MIAVLTDAAKTAAAAWHLFEVKAVHVLRMEMNFNRLPLFSEEVTSQESR